MWIACDGSVRQVRAALYPEHGTGEVRGDAAGLFHIFEVGVDMFYTEEDAVDAALAWMTEQRDTLVLTERELRAKYPERFSHGR